MFASYSFRLFVSGLFVVYLRFITRLIPKSNFLDNLTVVFFGYPSYFLYVLLCL